MSNRQIVDESQKNAKTVKISRPKPGETHVIVANEAQAVNLDFRQEDVNFEIRDVDLVIRFPDGSSVVLLGYGMRLVDGNGTIQFVFDGVPADAMLVLSRIASFVPADVASEENVLLDAGHPVLKNGGAKGNGRGDGTGDGKGDGKGDGAEGQQSVQVVEVQAESNSMKLTEDDEGEKSSRTGTSSSMAPMPEIKTVSSISTSSGPSSPSAGESTGKGGGTGTGNGRYNTPVPEVSVKVFSVADATEEAKDGGKIIKGALANKPADTDPTYASQMSRDTITGTDGNDTIESDDNAYAGKGTATRVLQLSTVMPEPGWTITGLKVAGLPVGFSVLGAKLVNGFWTIDIDPNQPELASLKLQYVIPQDGAIKTITASMISSA
jgi:hypothetical protein